MAGGTEQLDAFADVVDGYAQRGAVGERARPAGVSGGGRVRRERTGARRRPGRRHRRGEPRAGAHRARRQGARMAARRGTAPVGRVSSRPPRRRAPGSPTQATCRRCCGATGRRWVAHGVPVLDTSTVTNRKQLSDNITEHRDAARAASDRRGAAAAVRRDHPCRGHACCCPGTSGAPPNSSPAGRRTSCARSATSSRPPRPPGHLRRGGPVVARLRPTVSRIRCGTTSSRRTGPPTAAAGPAPALQHGAALVAAGDGG